MAGPGMAHLLHLRRRIDAAAEAYAPHHPETDGPAFDALMDALRAFIAALSEAWQAGYQPPPLPPEREAHLRDLLEKPVFIGGHYRTGTSLLRSMLDGHPLLLIHPAESCPPCLAASLTSPQGQAEALLEHSLMQLVLVDRGQGPRWLLDGDPAEPVRPYLDYVARFWAFVTAGPQTSKNILQALIYAYAAQQPGGPYRLWAHQGALLEAHVDALLADFPQARFLFSMRDPRGTYASAKGRYLRKYHTFDGQQVVETLRESYAAIERAQGQHGPDVCHVQRYETLVTRTESEMRAVARFLGLPFDLALLTPSQGGHKLGGLFHNSVDHWQILLTPTEQAYVSSYLHPYTEIFGYEPGPHTLPAYAAAAVQLAQGWGRGGYGGGSFTLKRAARAWLGRRRPRTH